MKLSYKDLTKRYDEFTASVRCKCTAATIIAGGQPGDEKGVRAFVSHHLKLEGQAAEDAVRRILKEEVGERPVPAETGELEEKLSYGINVIRRDAYGSWLGAWMLHACLKQAASRLRIFIDYKGQGAKGNWSEAARVRPIDLSRRNLEADERVYLVDAAGNPIQTEWHEFKGRVNSPQGSKSIVHHTECAPVGTHFDFEFQFIRGELKEDDISDVLALMMVVGIGSVKSLGCGKFRIDEAELVNESRSLDRKKAEREKRTVKTEAVTDGAKKAIDEVRTEQASVA